MKETIIGQRSPLPDSASLDLPALSCRYTDVCSGCAWISRPYSEQRDRKIQALKLAWHNSSVPALLPKPQWLAIAPGGLRDRVDLTIDNRGGQTRLGLFQRESREILDIEECPQLSLQLQSFVDQFRKLSWPIEKGSVRLRVAPDGKRGAWLDFANVDVKKILDDGTTLRSLQKFAWVEIGQRHKVLIEREGELKLGEPQLQPWFETYLGREQHATPLFMTVSSFSQPGFMANRALLGEVLRQVEVAKAKRVVEFGSGSGNFTLPLAEQVVHVDAYESDPISSQGLLLGVTHAGLKDKVTLHQGDYQRLGKNRDVSFHETDLVLADPPRSGLMAFLDPLVAMIESERPRHFVYVSCFVESFALDSARLCSLSYEPREITIIDQFPQSPHFELIARFEKT